MSDQSTPRRAAWFGRCLIWASCALACTGAPGAGADGQVGNAGVTDAGGDTTAGVKADSGQVEAVDGGVDRGADRFVPARYFFDPEGIHQVRIDAPPKAWAAILANAKDPKLPRAYHKAKVTLDGEVFAEVALRNFGEGSQEAHPKKPNVRVKFNLYDPKGNGPDKLNNLRLKASGEDPSFLREPLTYRALAAAGVKSARFSWARVVVNGEEYGLYQIIEQIDARFFKFHFGDKTGANYDPASGCGGFSCPGGDCDKLKAKYAVKSAQGDFKHVLAVAKAAVNTQLDAAGFRAVLEQHMDVDALMTTYGFEVFAADVDGFLRAAQNFELYVDPKTDKLHILRAGTDTTYYESTFVTFADPWALKSPCKDRKDPVYLRIQADPVLRKRFRDAMQSLRCEQLAVEATAKWLVSYVPRIEKALATEDEAKSGRVPANATGFTDGLILWLQKRHWEADKILGECPK